jgi:hypothetical protein
MPLSPPPKPKVVPPLCTDNEKQKVTMENESGYYC